MTNSPSTVLRTVLQMVQATGGRIDSRVRLQKIAYFMKHLGVPGMADVEYEYHYFGPYSRELSDSVRTAVSAGLLNENVEQLDAEIYRYSYELTANGEKATRKERTDTHWKDLIGQLMKATGKRNIKAFELASTAQYLIDEYGVDASKAMDKAVELKPGCKGVVGPARELLSQVEKIVARSSNKDA